MNPQIQAIKMSNFDEYCWCASISKYLQVDSVSYPLIAVEK